MKALILVDIQNDFCAGGALAVPDGDAVVDIANLLMPHFAIIAATQDFHPATHRSFAVHHPGKAVYDVVDLDGLKQVLWPEHCVQGSRGAELHPRLEKSRLTHIFPKGTDERVDSYSGFFDNGHRKATGLGDFLRHLGVTEVYVMGLATDYCVKWTALDAVKLGFQTSVIADGCRAVAIQKTDEIQALDEMKQAGVRILSSNEILQPPPSRE